ncbi:uroporphyrinogen decarboxylase family protein [Chloroflexota bacterium]
MKEKTAIELYQERDKRVNDAIRLEIPDRVPIDMSFGYFPAKYTGIPASVVYYEPHKWLEAIKKTVMDFQPDSLFYIQALSPGKAMEMLEPKTIRWPGYGVSPYHANQAIEGEWMKPDEYDLLLNDPTDFILRVYLPRIVGVMGPFSNLPKFSEMGYGYQGAMTLAETLAQPEMATAIERLQQIGQESIEWRKTIPNLREAIEELGFPVGGIGAGGSPFDQIMNNLRGMPGTMIDMFRQPDKLHELIDSFLQKTLARIASMPQRSDGPRVFMATHRGSDGFMSLKQFEEFYWPGLKKVILAVINKGLVPCIFFEGDWTTRLEYLLELPRAKLMAHFDSTDIFRAKEVLNNHICIRGNVPGSLLQTGTGDDVKDYCRKLIDIVGKDGGLVVCPRVVPDEVGEPPHNDRLHQRIRSI